MSSSTSQVRSASGARSFSSRSTTAHPPRPGAAVTARTSTDPAEVRRSAPSTDNQNRCGSRSSGPTGTHAALSSRPASAIHDRSSTVFPLPGGADTTVTRADAASRSNNPGRDTTPPAPGRATRPATAPDPSAGPLAGLFAQAGLDQAQATTLTVRVRYDSFEQWWEPFTLGVGPAGTHVASLTPDRRAELRERCRRLLPAGPFDISATTWAVTCRVPAPGGRSG